jgi:hypothetical protein
VATCPGGNRGRAGAPSRIDWISTMRPPSMLEIFF